MPPLVLAIEPDHRQAAIVKRIVREKVLADVTVVDSRDAALEAMRTTIPDVLLLSTLLSPRDEDELIAHLRTLEHAEHLQTHTIPQLASSITSADAKPKGLLSAFRKRKGETLSAGCDPDLFADEIRVYLQHASEKKREVLVSAAMDHPVPAANPSKQAAPSTVASEPSSADSGSSWSSPFEWRPASGREAPPARPVVAEPAVVAESVVAESAVVFEREVAPELAFAPEPAYVPEPVFVPEPAIVAEPAVVSTPAIALVPEPARARTPLIMRTARGWWFEEGDARSAASEPDSEMREVLALLSVPAVAAVSYAEGCRIRRVRVTAP